MLGQRLYLLSHFLLSLYLYLSLNISQTNQNNELIFKVMDSVYTLANARPHKLTIELLLFTQKGQKLTTSHPIFLNSVV